MSVDLSSMRRVLTRLVVLLIGALVVTRPSMVIADEPVTVIVGARAYASPDRQPIDDAVIILTGDRIRAVGPRSEVPIPVGARILTASGLVVVAGFWNSHVHLVTPAMLRVDEQSDETLTRELRDAFVQFGFTTLFDLASTTEIAAALERRIENGSVVGPRILSVGEPFYPGGATPVYARVFYEQFGLPSAEVASPEAARDRVRHHSKAGLDGIKLFTGSIQGETQVAYMPHAVIQAATSAADAVGLPVFAHPTDQEGLERAVSGGVDILAHAAPLMGCWSPDYANWIAEQQVAMIPTLSLFQAHPHPLTPVDVAVQQTRALHDAGGLILFGTDAGFTDEFDTRPELLLMQQAVGWRGVLASLTTAPAQVFGEADRRGRIEPGFIADLVILGGDPATDITALADVRLVIRSGRGIHESDQPAPPEQAVPAMEAQSEHRSCENGQTARR